MSGSRDSRLDDLVAKLRQFVAEREWDRFHDPKNLAMAIASEAGELLAELRWVANIEADEIVRNPQRRPRIENEVGDVAIALLLFCERAGIDLVAAAEAKLAVNAVNYPVLSSQGRSERPVGNSAGSFSRLIAVDWSGVASGGHETIWLAEVVDGRLITLENGRSREQVVERLIEIASADESIVVGLDFAFAFPAWFAHERGARDVSDVWRIAQNEGESWLRDCQPPFWGRPGTTKPALSAHFRETETRVESQRGTRPKSVFQVGGAGAVGTGSIRGMPHLLRLRAAGFSVWPFDPPNRPLVVEIYPRLLTGPVVKSDSAARTEYLRSHFPAMPQPLRDRAASTEDAFDAAVSALVMARHGAELAALGTVTSKTVALEGEIWMPASFGRG